MDRFEIIPGNTTPSKDEQDAHSIDWLHQNWFIELPNNNHHRQPFANNGCHGPAQELLHISVSTGKLTKF